MESIIFLVENRDGTIKGRTCANGSTQREYMDRDEAASPTAMTESIVITGVIDAKQRRDIMTADIPNAFVQTDIDKKEIGERIIMKIRGPLVDMLLELSYETYAPYVVYEGTRFHTSQWKRHYMECYSPPCYITRSSARILNRLDSS
jgi:hypothetical protein